MKTTVRECEGRWEASMKIKMLGNKWCVKAERHPCVETAKVKEKIRKERPKKTYKTSIKREEDGPSQGLK